MPKLVGGDSAEFVGNSCNEGVFCHPVAASRAVQPRANVIVQAERNRLLVHACEYRPLEKNCLTLIVENCRQVALFVEFRCHAYCATESRYQLRGNWIRRTATAIPGPWVFEVNRWMPAPLLELARFLNDSNGFRAWLQNFVLPIWSSPTSCN